MPDLNKVVDSLQHTVSDIKDISENIKDTTNSVNVQSTISNNNQNETLSFSDAVKTLETSKKLLWVLVGFFIFSMISIAIVLVVFSKDISNLLNFEVPLVTSTVLGYLGKSGAENYQKIKNSNNNNVDNSNTPDSPSNPSSPS